MVKSYKFFLMNFLHVSLHFKSIKPGCAGPDYLLGQVAEKIPANLIRIMPAKEGPDTDPPFLFHALY
jgi:hypothetical protein